MNWQRGKSRCGPPPRAWGITTVLPLLMPVTSTSIMSAHQAPILPCNVDSCCNLLRIVSLTQCCGQVQLFSWSDDWCYVWPLRWPLFVINCANVSLCIPSHLQVLRDFRVPEGVAPDSVDAGGDGEVLVVLDLNTDTQLLEAGIAREVVNRYVCMHGPLCRSLLSKDFRTQSGGWSVIWIRATVGLGVLATMYAVLFISLYTYLVDYACIRGW